MLPDDKKSKKPAFLAEDASTIEMTTSDGKHSIEKVDPAFRPLVKKQVIEGSEAEPSHPATEPAPKPRIDEKGFIQES